MARRWQWRGAMVRPSPALLRVALTLPFCLAACLEPGDPDTPGDDPASDEPAGPDAGDLVSTGEVAGVAYGPGGICLPRVCGLPGTAEGCGLQDDGCGGILWCGSCSCGSGMTACELDLPVIAEAAVYLGPSQTLTAEITSLSSGADSVLHILSSSGSQLAMNDDRAAGDPRSRVTYTAPWYGASVRIVARARTASTTGTAALRYLGSSYLVTLSYPARAITSSRAGDRLETAPLPGASATHVIYRMSGANIVARAAGTAATVGAAGVDVPSSGTTTYLVGQTGLTGASVPARLLRNDAAITGRDADGDGLGRDLEAALGTCDARSGTAVDRFGVSFSCSLAADAADTDGDGLRDGWEVLGRRDVSPAQALPRWGADPRHKDLFVEVDFGQSSSGEAEVAVTEAEVVMWADYFGDRVGNPTAAQRTAHAASLRNPDGKPGVRLHVDSGVAPSSARLRALHGDWGGHGVVPPAAGGGPTHYSDARAAHLAPARRGLFRYALRLASGAGQSDAHLAFVYGGSGRTAAHETGHTTDLMHDGVRNPVIYLNCKPNYPSLMNYAFDAQAVGFADGAGAPTLDNAALVETGVANPATQAAFLRVLDDVFGYQVDHATGSVDWNRDGLYAPAGQTVRAAANARAQDSCETTRSGSTWRAGAITSQLAPALARHGSRLFIFSAQAATVGWTYTASPLTCGVPDGEECATFATSGQLAGLDSARGVDAVRLPATGEVLVVGLGASYTLRWSLLTGVSAGAPQFGPVRTLGVNAALDQPTLALAEDGVPELFYRDAAGALFSRRYLRHADAWGDAQPLLDAAGAPVRMSLLGSPGASLAPPLDSPTTTPRMHLVFGAQPHDCMQLWYRAPAGHWVREPRLPSCGATHGDLRKVQGRPALAWVPDPAQQVLGGRLHVVWTPKYHDPDRSSLRQLVSVSDEGRGVRLDQEALYDNDWAHAYGIDLLFEAGVDDNLRAAWVYSDAFADPDPAKDKARRVRFDPVADGISSFRYGGDDDWRTMRRGVCRALATEQSPAVTCPAP